MNANFWGHSFALNFVVFALAGAAIGVAYYLSLWRVVCLFTRERAMRLALILQVGRVAAIVGSFFAVAQLGALPLLAAAMGLLFAREITLRWLKAKDA